MRGALVIAFSLLVACHGEVKIGDRIGGDKISHVSYHLTANPRFDRSPTRYFLKVEFTMPKRFPVGVLGDITMTDTSGRRFESMETSLKVDSEQVQRIGAKFEVAKDSQLGVMHVGDYDVDFASQRVTRRHSSTGP